MIDYKLNSVVLQLGNYRADHYVCFTFGDHSVPKIDEEKIEIVEYNSVRQIIRTCRYIFIYRKIGDRFLNDSNESYETNTETSDEDNSFSQGKFMKKRKLLHRMSPLSESYNHYFRFPHLSLTIMLNLSDSFFCLIKHDLKNLQLDDVRQGISFKFFFLFLNMRTL